MKSYICLLFFIFFISCNNKQDHRKDSVETDTVSKEVVAIVKNGVYELNIPEKVKKDFQKALEKNTADYNNGELFYQVLSGESAGSPHESYHMLVGKTQDGLSKIATILVEEDGELYIEMESYRHGRAYLSVICTGCTEGCDPVVSVKNNSKYINCSPCVDCLKIESEIR